MAEINEYGEIIRETKKILTDREQEIKNYIEKNDFNKAEKEKEDVLYELKIEYIHCFQNEQKLSKEMIDYVHDIFYNISLKIEKMLEERNDDNIDKEKTINYKETIYNIIKEEIADVHKDILLNKNKPNRIFERYSEIFDKALRWLDKKMEEDIEKINTEYDKLEKENNESKSFQDKYAIQNEENQIEQKAQENMKLKNEETQEKDKDDKLRDDDIF